MEENSRNRRSCSCVSEIPQALGQVFWSLQGNREGAINAKISREGKQIVAKQIVAVKPSRSAGV
jgi:hypothetical protein